MSKVSAVLKMDPDDAWLPIVGQGDPPICYAAHCMCDLGIIKMLLAHGANPNSVDVHMHTPIEIIAKQQNYIFFPGHTPGIDCREDQCIACATVLLAGGATLKESRTLADEVGGKLGCLLA